MRHSLLLLCLLLVPLVSEAETTSADLKRCPDGHTTLRDVPIVYGVPSVPSDVIARHVRRFDYILGGCDVMPDSPRVRPTCTTCRFGYDSQAMTWSRHSADPRSFQRPFSPLLTSFPRPAHLRSADYLQEVRDDRVISEEIWFSAGRDQPTLKADIDHWFRNHGIRATFTAHASFQPNPRWQARDVSVSFDYGGDGEMRVWFTHRLQPPKT